MVANLTRYATNGCSCGNYPCEPYVDTDGEWVKFEEAAEASSNSLQQLKAGIAALADEVFQMSLLHPSEQSFSGIVDRMRQLSAV